MNLTKGCTTNISYIRREVFCMSIWIVLGEFFNIVFITRATTEHKHYLKIQKMQKTVATNYPDRSSCPTLVVNWLHGWPDLKRHAFVGLHTDLQNLGILGSRIPFFYPPPFSQQTWPKRAFSQQMYLKTIINHKIDGFWYFLALFLNGL